MIIKLDGSDGPGIHKQAFHAPGQAVPATNDKFDNELGRDGGDGQIKPPQSQRWNAEYHSHQGRHNAGQGKRHNKRNTRLPDENSAGVRPHPHESSVPQGDLPGKPGQNIEPVTRDNGNARLRQNGHHVLGSHQGKEGAGDQERDQPGFHKPGLENPFIASIIFMKQSGRHYLYPFDFFNAKQAIGLDHQNQNQYNKRKYLVDGRDVGIQIAR